MNLKRNKRINKKIRIIIQISLFLLVFGITLLKYLEGRGVDIPLISAVSLHAVCPFGGVETLYRLFTAGVFIQKIHQSSLVLMTLVLLMSILFGPIFCGYLCPFGSFQEWIGKIGKKLFPKKYNHFIPKKLDSALRFLRIGLLALVLYQTARTAKLMFQNIDPYYALFNFFTNEVAISAYIILGIVIVLSLFVERPWCKYACPYGAILGLFNFIRIFRIKRNSSTCVNCKLCDNACPMNIKVSEKKSVWNHQCISCNQCTSDFACPIKDTVTLSAGGGKKDEN